MKSMGQTEQRWNCVYSSPFCSLVMSSDGTCLTGLQFERGFVSKTSSIAESRAPELPVFQETAQWLDLYFRGEQPGFVPKIRLSGTPFQLAVWKILTRIPYGTTTTYKAIAMEVACARKMSRMSCQAVGGAVGRNPVGIVIPCHRVIGSNGALTGYAGGLEGKKQLLLWEQLHLKQESGNGVCDAVLS